MKRLVTDGLFSLTLSLWGGILVSPANAQSSVNMRGSIIETACAIDVGSRDQTIDMGSLPLTQIRRDGQGPTRPFAIRLVNCVPEQPNSKKPNWQYFRVTFDGPQSSGLFWLQGQAKGVGLQIKRDDDGEIAVPGKSLSTQLVTLGTRDLIFQLRLVANHDPLVSGQYTSLLRFKLDYE